VTRVSEKRRIDFDAFVEWQAQDPKNRSVKVEIDRNGVSKVWVYDYNLMNGQHVTSVDEIRLEEDKEEQDRRTYERLKAKFEGRKKYEIDYKR